jgi:hypothetical protein
MQPHPILHFMLIYKLSCPSPLERGSHSFIFIKVLLWGEVNKQVCKRNMSKKLFNILNHPSLVIKDKLGAFFAAHKQGTQGRCGSQCNKRSSTRQQFARADR